MANSEEEERISRSWKTENKVKEKSGRRKRERTREQGEGGTRGQSASHTASHGARGTVRYTEVRKGKSSEAEGKWDNLS